ncbi:MAG: DUF1835 domain-containing protein [Cyanobacteria bacterium P01_H01_bin.121]
MEQTKQAITDGRLNLAVQESAVRALLRSYQGQTAAAVGNLTTLEAAQQAIASEAGFTQWSDLVAYGQALYQLGQTLETKESPPDSPTTLHIRCGSDIQFGLEQAGFQGEFLEFSDPYCQGPVLDLPRSEFIEMRAEFIATAYNLSLEMVQPKLQQEYAALTTLEQYGQVVLWFEHDNYDQLILAYLLTEFATQKPRTKLELICVDQVPSVKRFVGLGQLAPVVLRWLWQTQRVAVTTAHLELGQEVWQALTAPTPDALTAIAQRGTDPIPCMARALQRHLQELPSPQNGLSLTQQLTLELLTQHPGQIAGRLFGQLVTEREPLPYLGDTMFWYILEDLQQTEQPLFTIAADDLEKPWPRRSLTITDLGRQVLAGEANFLELYQAERWVGGIRIG